MPRFYVKFPLSLFTEHEASVNSSTVSTDTLCYCAELAATQYARAHRWPDGAGDLLAWAWQSLDRLRARGVAARAWSRALGYDFIDMLRVQTYYRSGRGEMEARTHNFAVMVSRKYGANHSFGDNGSDLVYNVEARREAPDTPVAVLADFENELRVLDARARRIVELLAEGATMWRIGEILNLSESRISQIIEKICEQFRGRYPKGLVTSDPFTPARRAHLAKLADANRARARAEQPETISENSDATG